MTRPMPEPPECTCMSRGNSCWTCVDTIGWDPEEDCPSCPIHAGRAYRKTKRLTDAECKAEFHAAHAEHLQVIIDNIGESVTAGTYAPTLNRLAVMERFGNYPHALEES